MVNAYRTPAVILPEPLRVSDIRELREAVSAGNYQVPAQNVAEALLNWHLGLAESHLPHEAAPLNGPRS
jgi:hypothetical protein